MCTAHECWTVPAHKLSPVPPPIMCTAPDHNRGLLCKIAASIELPGPQHVRPNHPSYFGRFSLLIVVTPLALSDPGLKNMYDKTSRRIRIGVMNTAKCPECGRNIPPKTGPGRRRTYCSDACRRLAYEHRRAATKTGQSTRVIHRTHIKETTRRVWAKPSINQISQLIYSDPKFVSQVLAVVVKILRQNRMYDEHIRLREQVGEVLLGWYTAIHSPGNQTWFWDDPSHEPADWDQLFGTHEVAKKFTEKVRLWGIEMKRREAEVAMEESQARDRAADLEFGLLQANQYRKEATKTAKRLLKTELALTKYELDREQKLSSLAIKQLTEEQADGVFEQWSKS